MKWDCDIFTISIDTMSEIGIIVLSSTKQLKKIRMESTGTEIPDCCVLFAMEGYTLEYMPNNMAVIVHMIACIIKIMPSTLFTFTQTCDIFYDELYEFIIIFVFLPVYITSPYTHFVFFNLAPLYSNCLSPSYTIVLPAICRDDENLCNYLSGILPIHCPLSLSNNCSLLYYIVFLWALLGFKFF